MITYTHTHTLKKIHVPDKSIDLFLFWGSLGFFTGGLRFGGFSTLLGLSLSVPECSEDKEHRLTVRYRHFGHVFTNYQQKCREKKQCGEDQLYLHHKTWPFCSSGVSLVPEVLNLLHLNMCIKILLFVSSEMWIRCSVLSTCVICSAVTLACSSV